MKKSFLYLVVFIFLSSCSASKSANKAKVTIASVEQVAKNNFGDNYQTSYNRPKTFVAITKKTNTEPYSLKIMVYNIKEGKILWGKKALKGKLKWISKNELQVVYFTTDNTRNILVYNVKKMQVSYK